MTSSDPDVIRRQIEDTRRELSYDVDALNEKVNPARVMDRRVTAAKGRVSGLKVTRCVRDCSSRPGSLKPMWPLVPIPRI